MTRSGPYPTFEAMPLWIALLVALAFLFGGVRRALRNHQGHRIPLDICLGAPVFWQALAVDDYLRSGLPWTTMLCTAAAITGYVWVTRGRRLMGLELGFFDPTYGKRR